MLPLTWCACYFPKIIILRFKVISEKNCKNPVNTEKTFSKYYTRLEPEPGLGLWQALNLGLAQDFQSPSLPKPGL
jgi:hypothetical protein